VTVAAALLLNADGDREPRGSDGEKLWKPLIGGEEMEMPLVRRIESGDGIQAWGSDEEGRSGLFHEDEK
jgi:hypothetical protein